jgi:hypothetical protein
MVQNGFKAICGYDGEGKRKAGNDGGATRGKRLALTFRLLLRLPTPAPVLASTLASVFASLRLLPRLSLSLCRSASLLHRLISYFR